MRAQLSWWGALAIGLLTQSTLLPLLIPDRWCPDVTRALVLWVALTGTPRGGAVLGFAAGLALDLMSGAPPGFHASGRLALYAVCRPFRGVFFDDRPVLLLPFAALTPLFDALVSWGLSWAFLSKPFPFSAAAAISWRQAVTESLTVPLAFLAIEAISGRRPRLRQPPGGEAPA